MIHDAIQEVLKQLLEVDNILQRALDKLDQELNSGSLALTTQTNVDA